MDDSGTCTSHCMEDLCRCASCYKDGLTCNSHQKTAVQAALPAELAWETVGGVGYVWPTTVPTVVPVVARAATCAEWRRHGFHLVAKVTYSYWHDPLSLSIVCSHCTQVWLVKQWAGLCCLESNTACSLLSQESLFIWSACRSALLHYDLNQICCSNRGQSCFLKHV